ncbi:hypothetical protein DTO006G1_7941 [Penicillium roqueforti]|nr:hypothetical protein CBS147337_10195 [Penicillium roqueforti]KAI2734263.1 hypothetical protein DTO013F2_10354 [Penicillium roqueforti]KAI2756577.1 hypothetical protein DTO006G1_7941 [Penicillium roqueforti]KAI3127408.1 hypothetical protein CBS147326_7198 [Penicillium roqueforti]KAI3257200.1 hypothetical protein DTO006G7_2767 [Penicillium roqueforti]
MKRSASTPWESLGLDPLPTNYTSRIPLIIGDTDRVIVYYKSTLDCFRQPNCSAIIKAAIKFIEPGKRFEHPYNRKDATKPDWWPSHITHKHPQHMRKEDRIELLIHILYNLGGYGLTADKLKEVAAGAIQNLRDPEDVKIIYEVLRVRKLEEQFERNEIDANTVTYLKRSSAEGSTNAAPAVIEAPRDQGLEQGVSPASDYATTESSSTLLKFEDADTFVTFRFQARDGYGTGTDTSPHDSSTTALSDMVFQNPINQESHPVFIERNGLPGYYNQDLLS